MPGIPEPKTAVPVTASQLEKLALDMQDFAAKLQLAASVARDEPSESLAIYNWASAITGVKAMRSFIAKVDESRSAAELGSPLKPGQLKPRSTAKKSAAGQAEEARLDKLEARNEAYQRRLDAKTAKAAEEARLDKLEASNEKHQAKLDRTKKKPKE